jgi:hypothetical protein
MTYTETYGLYIFITIHLIGFLIYLPFLKFILKKSVPFKMVTYYIIAWLIALPIFSFSVLISQGYKFDYPVEMIFATIGEMIGLGIGFLIFDGIVWYLCKWLYEKTHKKINDKK